MARESEDADAEADLLVLLDGEAMLCEVKASWSSLRAADVADFVTLASRLRPDVALLAVMDAGPGPADDLTRAREQLASQEVKFELLTWDRYKPEDDPYLDFE